MTGRWIALGMAAIALAACASQPPQRKGPGGPPGGGGRAGASLDRQTQYARPVGLLFVSFDIDNDLLISRAEFDAGVAREWRRLDANENGESSGFEALDWAKAVLGNADAEPSRVSLDSDFNGIITQDEFRSGLSRLFVELDHNGDNQLDRSELLAHVEARMGVYDSGGGQGAAPGGGRPGGGRNRPRGGGYPG